MMLLYWIWVSTPIVAYCQDLTVLVPVWNPVQIPTTLTPRLLSNSYRSLYFLMCFLFLVSLCLVLISPCSLCFVLLLPIGVPTWTLAFELSICSLVPFTCKLFNMLLVSPFHFRLFCGVHSLCCLAYVPFVLSACIWLMFHFRILPIKF